MALRGNLRDFHTSQLLNLIHLARKTGTLTVESRNGTAQLCFKDGKLIHAVLDRQDGRLADVLIRAGKLRPEQLQALDLSRVQDDKVLGLKLIEAGYVTQQDILASLRAQMLDVVYRLFGWNEGAFRFEPHLQPVQNRIPVPVDLENVIMEGVRRLREVERLKEELPDLDIPVRLTSRPEAIRKVQLSPEEWRVISQVNGRNTIEQIMRRMNMDESQIRRIVYGLLQAGLIELGAPPPIASLPGLPDSRPGGSVSRSVVEKLINYFRRL
ncbi:MAG: DUF4388 domain-containing protein [Thermoflexus sp.]|jgi:hypothetical protein|nr:DUF4388 domain-containing protein [Thermoflexus sp.]